MEDFSLKQLGKLVYDKCGLNYLSTLGTLESKISKRLQTLSLTTWEYIRFIQSTPSEWDQLIELLTINETYFFREEKQLKVFQELVSQMKLNMNRPIRIWSAACSTGEEPYSLAMMIRELEIPIEHFEIHATDIDKRVLQVAKNGTYNKQSLSFRRIPQDWLEKFFIESDKEFQVHDDIRNMVHFHHLNLLDHDAMNAQRNFDFIFCRNVLIYFDQTTIKHVVSNFYQSLNQQGFLFLGHSENISSMGIGFETVSTSSSFYYRKG